MSETPVIMGWRRCDLEMPRQRPRRSQWVVDTSSRRSDHCESKNLEPNTLVQAGESFGLKRQLPASADELRFVCLWFSNLLELGRLQGQRGSLTTTLSADKGRASYESQSFSMEMVP